MTEPQKSEFVMGAPNEKLDDLDYWRLCDELSILQAALLHVGLSPSQYSDVEAWTIAERPTGYEATKTAIRNALRDKQIVGVIECETGADFNGNEYDLAGTVSVSSRLKVASLKTWLAGRGIRRGFFFPEKLETPDYLDPQNPRYAPKLAAAVRAWQAVVDPGGKSPKGALTKWLREHAAELGFTDEEGKLNETGIEDVAKVANWQPGGGAPKTPFASEPTPG
jgi:hypothetical protein